MEQLRLQNAQKINITRILRVEKILFDIEKRKKLEKHKRKEDKVIKDVTDLLKLKKRKK